MHELARSICISHGHGMRSVLRLGNLERLTAPPRVRGRRLLEVTAWPVWDRWHSQRSYPLMSTPEPAHLLKRQTALQALEMAVAAVNHPAFPLPFAVTSFLPQVAANSENEDSQSTTDGHD